MEVGGSFQISASYFGTSVAVFIILVLPWTVNRWDCGKQTLRLLCSFSVRFYLKTYGLRFPAKLRVTKQKESEALHRWPTSIVGYLCFAQVSWSILEHPDSSCE